MTNQQTRRNHYAPQTYQKRWARPSDGRVCQYWRPHKDVKCKWVAPAASGYQDDLYTLKRSDGTVSTHVEDKFFKRVDQDASDVLDKILRPDGTLQMSARERSAWARFLMSMMNRHPQKMESLKAMAKLNLVKNREALQANWEKTRPPTAPIDYADAMAMLGHGIWNDIGVLAMPKVSDMPEVGEALVNMQWQVVNLTGSKDSFMTSDRPVIYTSALAAPDAFVLMPISPQAMFIAAKSIDTFNRWDELIEGGLGVAILNEMVVRQAGTYAYADNDQMLDFVRLYFSAAAENSGGATPNT